MQLLPTIPVRSFPGGLGVYEIVVGKLSIILDSAIAYFFFELGRLAGLPVVSTIDSLCDNGGGRVCAIGTNWIIPRRDQ